MNSHTISNGVNPDALYANAFNFIPEIGPARLLALRKHFSSFQEAWGADTAEISQAGVDNKVIEAIRVNRPKVNLEDEIQKLEHAGVRLLLEGDPDYPPPLRNMAAPPQTLYIRGSLPPPDAPSISIVGTRHPTRYGIEACNMLSRKLTEAGIVIVSGMAIGIDTVAHRSCLDAEGITVAVVGSGLAPYVLYPSSNKQLAERIVASGGAIVSEYALEMKAQQWMFPLRNRIIAALSAGTMVVEAKQKSGALITASFAIEFGKEVFAVPGDIFSENTAGPHSLIRQGAALVTSVEDIFHALQLPYTTTDSASAHTELSDDASLILSFLNEAKTSSDIVQESGKDTAFINQTLSLLEIHGMIKRTVDNKYRKC